MTWPRMEGLLATAARQRHVDFAFFASRPEFTRKSWDLARQAGASIVDLSYGLEDVPGVTAAIDRMFENSSAPVSAMGSGVSW